MSVEIIKEIPIHREHWYSQWAEGSRTYQVSCDVCGKKEVQTDKTYNYGFGDMSGWRIVERCGFKTIEYGTYNRRAAVICPDHKDAEIEAKIKEWA